MNGEEAGLRQAAGALREKTMDSTPDAWHQLMIRDPENLSAASVDAFVERIIARLGMEWVIVSDVEAAAWSLKAPCWVPIPAAEFLSLVTQASQYDWAFFFMSKSKPSLPSSPDLHQWDRMGLLQSDITVRLSDGCYFVVYTTNGSFSAAVREWYPSAEHKLVKFDDLWVPY